MIQRFALVAKLVFGFLLSFYSIAPLRAEQVGLTLGEIRAAQNGEEARKIVRVVELIRSGDAETAKTLAMEHAQSNKDSASGPILIASALIQLGDVSGAMAMIEDFVRSEADGRLFEASVAFAVLARTQGRRADAWAHCLVASTTSPPSRWSKPHLAQAKWNLQVLMAAICLERQWWAEARQRFEELESERPDDGDVVRGAGIAAFREGDIEIAVAKIKRSGELSPQQTAHQLVLASLYSATGQSVEAETWFQDGLQQDVERVIEPYFSWLIDNNRPEQVLEQFAKLSATLAESDTNQYWFALAHRMMRDFDEAEDILSDLHQKLPANLRLSNQFALVLIESSSKEKRAKALQIATANARRAKTAEILATLGWIQYRMGEPEQAEKTLVIACQNPAVTRDAAYFLAEVKQAIGKTEESDQIRKQVESATGPFFYADRN